MTSQLFSINGKGEHEEWWRDNPLCTLYKCNLHMHTPLRHSLYKLTNEFKSSNESYSQAGPTLRFPSPLLMFQVMFRHQIRIELLRSSRNSEGLTLTSNLSIIFDFSYRFIQIISKFILKRHLKYAIEVLSIFDRTYRQIYNLKNGHTD